MLSYTWAGNAASGNAYRIRPINALNGHVNFDAANPRPASAPAVGGTVRVVGMNLLNFFNTFAGCTNGVGGPPTDCRGADNPAEFDRQHPKTVAAILAMNPDVLGVNEIENDGYGPASALQFLVDRLNAATAPGTFAFIDVDANTGQPNAMGTDAIRVAMLYKPAVVTPAGQTAALNTVAFVNGGDSGPRSRPSLAQAFSVNATGAVFIAGVNHLKSKGSACDAAGRRRWPGQLQPGARQRRDGAAGVARLRSHRHRRSGRAADRRLQRLRPRGSDHGDHERRVHQPDRVVPGPRRLLVRVRRTVGLSRPRARDPPRS